MQEAPYEHKMLIILSDWQGSDIVGAASEIGLRPYYVQGRSFAPSLPPLLAADR